MVYASERYVFTTCFVMGLVIVDSLVGGQTDRSGAPQNPFVLSGLHSRFAGQCFLAAKFMAVSGRFRNCDCGTFFSAAARSLLFFGGIGKLGQRSACNRP